MKKLIKNILKNKGYEIRRSAMYSQEQKVTREDFFNLYFSTVDPENFCFVQAGANDGVSNDPIHKYIAKYKLKGVTLEPQPRLFAKLQKNYIGYPVKPIMAGLGPVSGDISFYSVKKFVFENLPSEASKVRLSAMASFDKDRIIAVIENEVMNKMGMKGTVEDFLDIRKVPVLTFNELCEKNDIDHVDFIQLDIEGLDWQVLKTVDIKKYNPTVINIETQCLSKEGHNEVEKFLTDHGYNFFYDIADICAYKIK